MTIIFLQNIFEKSINGEWGNEDSGKGEATAVIRTSNFPNSGRLNLDNIVCREIDKDKNSGKILRTGDIIIEKSGGSPNQPVGRVVYFDVTDQDYFTNNFTSILRVKPEYNSKYIFYLMKYLYDTKKVLKFQNQTTGIINLKLADYLNKTKVNIEAIENQNTIVDILDRLEYQIINRNKQLSELSNLVKSRFNEMFGDVILNDKEWKISKWNEILTIRNGKNQKNVEDKNGQFPIYGSGGIIGYAKDWIVKKNSVIIGRKGNINKPILVRENFWNVDTAFGLEPTLEKINSEYLFYFCQLYNFEKLNKAVTIPSLTKSDLLDISLPLPLPPLTLQNEFADFVAQVDKSQLAIQKSLEELETLKKSLMQEYFG